MSWSKPAIPVVSGTNHPPSTDRPSAPQREGRIGRGKGIADGRRGEELELHLDLRLARPEVGATNTMDPGTDHALRSPRVWIVAEDDQERRRARRQWVVCTTMRGD